VTPVVRSFVSIPAGVFRVPFWRYTVLTLIGSAIWCFAIAGIGWALGKSWDTFHRDFRYADFVILAIVVAVAIWLFLRWRSSRLAGRADDPAG
jgi:membrane protein DedA with SNARE-associated domain